MSDVLYRMKYRQYKQRYADCDTVPGTYDKNTKTIEVIVPDGRMKPSGVRGQTFSTYFFMCGTENGALFKQGFRAISRENALKQAKRNYSVVVAE